MQQAMEMQSQLPNLMSVKVPHQQIGEASSLQTSRQQPFG